MELEIDNQSSRLRDRKMIEKVKETVNEEKGVKEADDNKLETFNEELSAQLMYIGPYSEKEATAQRLQNFIEENSYNLRWVHHEIYMSIPEDFRLNV